MDPKRCSVNVMPASGRTASRWRVWWDSLAAFTQGLDAGRPEPGPEADVDRPDEVGRVQGTVVSLGGRFPPGSSRFRFERMDMLDARRNKLMAFPIHETAEVASGVSVGMQVTAIIRNGSIVAVKKKPVNPGSATAGPTHAAASR